MYKLILTMMLWPALAAAAPVTVNKTVVCDQAGPLMQFLQQTHGEVPVWLGAKQKSAATIFANLKTQSWTIVYFQGQQDIACVLETGVGYQFLFPPPG